MKKASKQSLEETLTHLEDMAWNNLNEFEDEFVNRWREAGRKIFEEMAQAKIEEVETTQLGRRKKKQRKATTAASGQSS